jgi:predicted tellurium resistance membrane protein TerC
VDGAFVIIAWVGVKLLIEYGHAAGYLAFEVPKFISLGVIVVIFCAALGYALLKEKAAQRHEARR